MANIDPQHQDEETQLGGDVPAAGGAPGAMPPAEKASQRFVNIQRLLTANQGQGSKLVGQAIGNADQLANSAKSQLDQATGAYASQAQGAVPKAFTPSQVLTPPGSPTAPAAPPAAGVRMTPISAPAAAPQTPGFRLSAPASPFAGPKSPASVAPATSQPYSPLANQTMAQQAAQATYAGPQSLADTRGVNMDAVTRAFQNASAAGNALGTPGGVAALLGRTGGIGAFDQLLAQHEGTADLNAARGRFSGLQDLLTSAATNTAPADAAKAATAGVAQGAQGYLDQQAAAQVAATQKAGDEANAASKADTDAQAALAALKAGHGGIGGMAATGAAGQVLSGSLSLDWLKQHPDVVQQILGRLNGR
jgi:hypothetical protein